MKLKNRKTGERGIINYFDNQSIVIYPIDENWNAKGDKKYVYRSLAELNEEWEDMPEEPKEYWYVSDNGYICTHIDDGDSWDEHRKEIGNYFEAKEEAKKAVKKLKAWKRLKDIGCRFILDDNFAVKFVGPEVKKIVTAEEGRVLCDDYRLLFGGEE